MIELQVCDSGGSQRRATVTCDSFAAAYATAGLSVRMSQLAELDRRDDEARPSTPPYRGAHRAR